MHAPAIRRTNLCQLLLTQKSLIIVTSGLLRRVFHVCLFPKRFLVIVFSSCVTCTGCPTTVCALDRSLVSSTNEEMNRQSEGSPAEQIEQYRLGREIGRGGFGVVFEALDTITGERVAVKRISLSKVGPEELADLQAEINLLRQLKHPNIVRYIGSIRGTAYLYLVTEWVEGGSLSGVVKRFGALNEVLAGIYAAQVSNTRHKVASCPCIVCRPQEAAPDAIAHAISPSTAPGCVRTPPRRS